ncbi:MAG: autorepressor SdpR family transcription factor [Oscillospiraceae bacterium]
MQHDIFKALGDVTRRQILEMLAKEGDLSAGDIAARFEMSAPSVSHHLSILKASGLLQDRREKQHVVYHLNRGVLEKLRAWLDSLEADATP